MHGYPPELIRRVTLLQACTGVTVRTQYGQANTAVVTTKGCKQGCPLSPVTYCLFINTFLKGLSADPRCGPYYPPQGRGEHDTTVCRWLCSALRLLKHSKIEALDAFLEAYGLSLNATKCRHIALNEPALQIAPPLRVRATHADGSPVPIPSTIPTGMFEYLSHHMPERQLGLPRSHASSQTWHGHATSQALWTAMFSECARISSSPPPPPPPLFLKQARSLGPNVGTPTFDKLVVGVAS